LSESAPERGISTAALPSRPRSADAPYSKQKINPKERMLSPGESRIGEK